MGNCCASCCKKRVVEGDEDPEERRRLLEIAIRADRNIEIQRSIQSGPEGVDKALKMILDKDEIQFTDEESPAEIVYVKPEDLDGQ